MARYMRTDLGRGHTKLSPPAVIAGAIAWHGPGVYLTYPSQAQNLAGARRARSALRPPTVVTQPVVETFSGPRTHLTQPRRTGPFHSTLRAPAVIGAGRVNPGLRIKLTFGRRGAPRSFLRPPIAAEAVEAGVFFGPEVHLTRIRPPRVYPDLGAPIVVDSGGALGWLATSLAPQRRGQAKSFLGEPIVAPALVRVYYGPELTLVRRRTPAVHSFLRLPIIPPLARPLEVTLAQQRRGAPHSLLQPPRVVFLAVEIYGPEQTLTRITPPPVFSVLRPPAVVAEIVAAVYYGPEVRLTYSRGPLTRSVLRAPAVVGAGRVNPGLRIKLAFGRRGVAKSRLFPPISAAAVRVAGQLQVNLTYSRRGRTLSGLGRVPRVVVEGPQGGVLISLAPQRRGAPKSFLRKPVVVTAIVVVYFGPQVTLRPQRRGQAKSFLRKPVVTAAPPAYRQVLPPALAYSRRGAPHSFLRPPTRVFPFFARKTEISLAPQRRGQPTYFLRGPQALRGRGILQVNLTYSRRGRPKSILRGPRVVRLAVEIYGPETWLTYSRRGRPQYQLNPPAVVGKAPLRGIKTWLTRIRPRPTVSLIKPPTVVRIPVAGVLQVHLTYSRRGRPVYFTTPFTPGKAPFRPIQVHLTRIKPQPTISLIKPPSVVGAGIAFFGPSVTLVRITPPPVISFLKLTLVAFRRPGGDVCGFDIAGSFVCYLELPGSQVAGSERAGAQVSGSSRAANRITSSESATGGVSGSDRKAT